MINSPTIINEEQNDKNIEQQLNVKRS